MCAAAYPARLVLVEFVYVIRNRGNERIPRFQGAPGSRLQMSVRCHAGVRRGLMLPLSYFRNDRGDYMRAAYAPSPASAACASIFHLNGTARASDSTLNAIPLKR
jgi:hypothetical protein